jgi:hypothetical protein
MSSPHRSLAVVALLLLAAVAAAPGPDPGSVGTSQAAEGPGTDEQYAQAVDADSVQMTVALQPDGDAVWTVGYYVHLEDDNETAAFESLEDDVESDPDNYTERFAERMRSTVRTAADATGREMSVRNVTVDARTQNLGRTYGILEYTFEWTGFAVVDGDTVTAGDALDGLFLDEQTTLVFTWQEGYGLVDARPPTDDDIRDERTVGWAGPRDFGDDEPRVVVERRSGGPGGLLADLPGGALLGAVLVAMAGIAAVLWSRRRGAPFGSAGGAGGGDGTADGDGTQAAARDDPPEELLSNEEKVLKLVREQGGRVKQQEIVQAFDWTEAKTSQVVRDLRDEGALEGFRLGRENVLRLPEEDDEGGA